MRAGPFSIAFLAIIFAAVRSAWPQGAEPKGIAARSETPVVIQKLSQAVIFDGLSNEDAWMGIPVFPMVMMIPNFGFPASEKTEVLVAFDDDYLWLAGRLYDREPAKIQARSKKRDLQDASSDFFAVIIDTFNDKENALSFGAYSRLFYSRRLGLYEDEEQETSEVVPIYGGIRLIGRAGSWDLGLMDMQTAPLEERGVPGENFGVVRVRRRILNPYSYVGGMITSRIGADGSYNEAYGLDGILRLSEDDYLTFG